jgi:type IV pilus assembly protein PilV
MKKSIPQASRQSGVMLIEALIALLIFSVGILGIVGLQATAVKASSDAKYRSEAALMANELIGKMWASDRTQAVLQAAFASPAGTEYQKWAWLGVLNGSPGTNTAAGAADGTVYKLLPGAAATPPTVSIVPVAGATKASSLVTVRIFWQAPNETTGHNYVAQVQIGG